MFMEYVVYENKRPIVNDRGHELMKPSRNINRLIEIMAALRHPQTGCPWDIAQNFQSILPYTIEEAYEVADAVRRGERADLCEELGDLLLQVVYHARMAEEEGSFAFGDVVEAITRKMIRRHPHVFGTQDKRKAGMADDAWETIKTQEKAEKMARQSRSGGFIPRSRLDDVSSALPSHREALKLQQKAAKTGFDWPDAGQILEKLREETEELAAAVKTDDKTAITDEYGDLIFTIINLGRKLGLDAETALAMTNRKFRNRFSYIEQKVQEKQQKLEDANLEEMEALWVEAKNSEPKI